jgi:hypothetical protein
MTLKKLTALLLMTVLAVALAVILHAQTESEIAVTRSDWQADRQALVAANLPMTEAEAAAFWPVYRTYRAEIAVIGDQSVKLVTSYANSYNDVSVTDEQGVALTKDFLKLQKASVEIKQKYVGRFNKVLPGKSVMRFYQIENKLDAMMAVSVSEAIPLVD